MPNNLKFPPSVEIKRAIAAAQRAGIEIGSIEIYPRKIVIHPASPIDRRTPAEIAYDEWKISEQRNSQCVRHSDEQSDVLPKKPRR